MAAGVETWTGDENEVGAVLVAIAKERAKDLND